MKIKDTLVVTLPDFSRLIDFPTFWHKRRQFIRDLSPQRCYYRTDKQKLLLEVIKTWIDIEDGIISENEWTYNMKDIAKEKENSLAIVGLKNDVSIHINIQYEKKFLESLSKLTQDKPYRYVGVIALCELTEKQICLDEIQNTYNVSSNNNTPIIKILAGTSLYYQGVSSTNSNDAYWVRKIEPIGEGNSSVDIYIDNIRQKSLEVGECAYAICRGSEFVKILPNELQNEKFGLTMCSNPGEFASSLEVEHFNRNNTEIFDNVTSLAFDNAGYPVFTTVDGELHIDPSNFVLKNQLSGFKRNYPNIPILAIEEKNGFYKFYTSHFIYG